MHIQGKKKGILVSTILFITAGLILAYPQSLMDTYLPVLPYLDNALNTSDMLVQYTVACFLLGNALSQLASGVLSDYFGRIKILLLGLAIAILGSILCYIGYNIIFMLIGRAIQGVGSGMAAILMRVIIADSFPGKSFSKVYSFLVAFSILMIAVGPVIASHLMQYYGWESVMSFMLGYAIIIGLLVVTSITAVSCTLSQTRRVKKQPRQVWTILCHKQFLMTTLVMFFIYGVMASILLSYPYIFIQVYHMQVSDFGWVIALVVLCMLAGAILNNLLLRRFSSIAVTKTALIIMFVSMVGILLSSMNSTYTTDLICLSLFWLVYLWVYPNMLGMVSALFPALTGTAISIFSFIQIMGGVAFTAFGAFHLLDNVYELGLTGVTGILFALLMFIYMQRALKNNKANS